MSPARNWNRRGWQKARPDPVCSPAAAAERVADEYKKEGLAAAVIALGLEANPGKRVSKVLENAGGALVKGANSKLSRNGAFRGAKEKAGVPRTQHPDRVYKERIRDQDEYVEGSVYEFRQPGGRTVTIKEHSLGHQKDNHGPHFNTEARGVDGNKVPLRGNADSHTYFRR